MDSTFMNFQQVYAMALLWKAFLHTVMTDKSSFVLSMG